MKRATSGVVMMGAGRDRGDVSRLVLHGWEGRRVPRAVNCTVGRLVDPKGGMNGWMDGRA